MKSIIVKDYDNGMYDNNGPDAQQFKKKQKKTPNVQNYNLGNEV